MINLKRVTQIQERDHSQYCQHHCALCKTPCEKQGRYPSLPGIPPPPLPVGKKNIPIVPKND